MVIGSWFPRSSGHLGWGWGGWIGCVGRNPPSTIQFLHIVACRSLITRENREILTRRTFMVELLWTYCRPFDNLSIFPKVKCKLFLIPSLVPFSIGWTYDLRSLKFEDGVTGSVNTKTGPFVPLSLVDGSGIGGSVITLRKRNSLWILEDTISWWDPFITYLVRVIEFQTNVEDKGLTLPSVLVGSVTR